MPKVTVRRAGPADTAALAALRRAWTAEQTPPTAQPVQPAPLAQDTPLAQATPPGHASPLAQDTPPGHAAPPVQAGPPAQDALPGHDAPPASAGGVVGGGPPDAGFEARFQDWLDREGDRRLCWLAEVDGEPAGMVNLAVFTRMPRPGKPDSSWGYLGNAYVRPGHRDRGVGSALVAALLAYARAQGLVRVVLSPSARSVPFYERAGFHRADELMLISLSPPSPRPSSAS